MIWVFGTALIVAAELIPNVARADWSVSGAQYSCNAHTKTFELLPHDQSSSDPPGGIPLAKGFKALPDGITSLNCALGARKLQVQIGVTRPQAGQCMGGGSVTVTSLAVDGVELLDLNMPFDSTCGNEESIVRVRVRTSSQGVEFETCSVGAPDVPGADAKRNCATKLINVDVIAAKQAKLDHELADIRTQEATSVTKLPAFFDLARVFARGPMPPDVPLCAHWSDTFFNSLVKPERQWHARIAGTVGERILIHPTSPPLCRNSADDGCSASAYVVPGDRVDLGFICGPWSYVQFDRHLRSKRSIKGWVETARLYGDDHSTNAATAAPASHGSFAMPPGDPLVAAAFINDLAQIKEIIAAGESPDGLTPSNNPLLNAAVKGHLGAVKLLLSLGANLRFADGRCLDLFSGLPSAYALPAEDGTDIFSILTKAGADLNCRSQTWHTTALMNLARSHRLWAWQRFIDQINKDGNVDDRVVLFSRLLRAGADPNVRDLAGQTALFYACEPNNVDLAEILLAGGANPNIAIDESGEEKRLGDQSGNTPLMRALAWYPMTRDPTMIQMLLEHGADPNYRNSTGYDEDCDATTQGKCTFQGQTALTRATEDGEYTVVRVMLEHGADPKVPRADGLLPVDIARQNHHPEIAQLLEKAVSQR